MSSLLPISEKGEEDIDIVPSYDNISDQSFYEKVNGPNPAYQQYNRKGVGGIPINLMNPKQHRTETIENTLFDAEGVTDLEEEPVTVSITKQPTDGMTGDVVPVYAVPKKRATTSTSVTSGFLHTCEDADVVPVSSYLEVEDVDPDEHKAAAGHDMSIFVSKLDDKADPGTEGDISASMDNDSDDVFTAAAANVAARQQVFRTDSIVSTTSENRDLLDTDKKLKNRPKVSHSKPKCFGKVNVAAKSTPSPKPKRAHLTKAPTGDSRDTNMGAPQQQIGVARTESISSTTSDNRNLLDTDVKVKDHPKISQFLSNISAAIKSTPSPKSKRANLRFKPPTADSKVTQPVAKYTSDGMATQLVTKDTTAGGKLAKDTIADIKTARNTAADSKMTQSVAKEHFDKHDYKQVTSQVTQTKPPQNFKPTVPHQIDHKFPHKASPKLNARHGNQPTAPSPKLLSKSKVAPTTGAYLNTSHPTQINPLAQLRAKSSPRVKPRSTVHQQLDTKPDSTMATNQVTKQQLSVPEPTKGMKRSSIATDKPVTDDVTDKAAADEKRRHTVCDWSYKGRRDKEMDELDQSLKDLDDFITTI